jgi:hypothetical protein
MALAVVMIYQAIDHLNFAQGEMAMFSTFISWQMMQWGVPYWGAFVLTLAISFAGGILIERLLFKPLAKAPILTNVAGFIALFAIINSVAGLIWDFTIKQYPTPFGSSPFLGSQLISTHQAGMIGVTVLLLILLYFFFQFTRVGLAMRAAASLPESARLVGINTSWMIALGWGMGPRAADVQICFPGFNGWDPEVQIPRDGTLDSVTLDTTVLPDPAFVHGQITGPDGLAVENAELKVYLVSTELKLCSEVAHAPSSCPIPAQLQGRDTSAPDGTVRLALPR